MPKLRKQTNPTKQTGAAVIKSPDVQEMAEDLIERYHHKLRSAKIGYGFSTRTSKRFGNVVKVPDAFRVLAERGTHFLVVVNKARWDGHNQRERQAAVDELLCSMSFDEMTPRIEAPDFRGYRANILRFGARTDELEHAFRGCQLILPGVDEIEAELAPAPPCDDCGDPADKDMIHEGKALCPVCHRWRQESADPGRSNADDEGAHCEGCNSWGREGRLIEQSDGRSLCWKCVATTDADVSVTLTSGGQSVTTTASKLDRLPNMTQDELGDLPGVDFTEHETAEVA
jgi:hypothetical protein